ncbi:hypothetical protein G7B40_030855 [Aetokthonos hydrillicola Thurmond2011]|jgi:hypothetical protein|uniref:Uncharacterized protein n=1 Tax=Aetokthonos hydrillicola Thurmond2011 TaxID=2712845 RepID=A0AAP5MD73_9CYAN|nr:hypothetical protein [Aetokthonos hydrillicola]MBO3464000.1 hypothetical protein [Aetokthonos hydrillicola CCALA 1050]MBW4589670.1 hypothetical protein [Aetokthonos hydrillicola CCALA 1050]MDR9898924.1 hypothetical protein [Aetokthonos hydrillicola Thurmond2011]
MWTKIEELIKMPWIKYPLFFVAVLFVSVFVGRVYSGFTLIKNDKEISFDLRTDAKLPNELDITGEWVYLAETNQKENIFSEDFCKKRFGSVDINHTGSNEVNLSGVRKANEDCTTKKVVYPKVEPKNIRWVSDSATILVQRKHLTVWFHTDDKIPRLGYMYLSIINEPNSIKPPGQLNGTMFYLNDEDKKWFRANVELYRVGSQKATDIAKKW